MAGPARDERDMVPAIIDICLGPAEHITGMVPLGGQLCKLGLGRAAVVTRDDDHGILRKALLLQRLEHLPYTGIRLHDEVGIGIEPALALPLFGGSDGSVRSI